MRSRLSWMQQVCSVFTSFGLLAGAAYSQGTPTQLLQETGPNNSQFGWDVNGLGGDVNADGTPDYIVGAPANQVGINVPGSAFVMSGTGGIIRQHDKFP